MNIQKHILKISTFATHVIALDFNSEHVAHVGRNTGPFRCDFNFATDALHRTNERF